jgi:hypothetical protein
MSSDRYTLHMSVPDFFVPKKFTNGAAITPDLGRFKVLPLNMVAFAVNVVVLGWFTWFLEANSKVVQSMTTDLTSVWGSRLVSRWQLNIPMLVYTWNYISTVCMFFFAINSYRTSPAWKLNEDEVEKIPGSKPIWVVHVNAYQARGGYFQVAFFVVFTWTLIAVVAPVVLLVLGHVGVYTIFAIPCCVLLFVLWFSNDAQYVTTETFTNAAHDYTRYVFYTTYLLWIIVTTLSNDLLSSNREYSMSISVLLAYAAIVAIFTTRSDKSNSQYHLVFAGSVLGAIAFLRGAVVNAVEVHTSNVYDTANTLYLLALVVPVMEMMVVVSTQAKTRLLLRRIMLVLEFVARGMLTTAVVFDIIYLRS